jgi:hypothetical protein
MRPTLSLALAGLVAFALSAFAQPVKDTGLPKEDLDVLKRVNLKADAASLLDYLRKQTHPEADPKQMEQLIRDLGDDVFQVREQAYGKLITLGKTALVGLKQAEKDTDPEVRHRAKDLRERLEAKVEPAIQIATVRLLARMKPAGTAEVLLNFVPFAPDLSVTDEVCKALDVVAKSGGGIEPVIVKSLDDKNPIKRGAAGEAIIVAKNAEHLPAARQLIKDSDPLVRVRIGLALVQTKDKAATVEALPALIDCLQHLPPENLWSVEDILIRLAGDGKAPTVSLGTNDQARELTYKAWHEWYTKHQGSIDLARLDATEPSLGHTLIVYQSFNRVVGGVAIGRVARPMAGEVVEVDHNKKVLWKLELTDTYPVDAQVVPDRENEVAIAEYQRGRITIRDHTQKNNSVVWEKAVNGNPIGVQALPGGKIFAVLQNRLIEIDRADKSEKLILNRPNHDIFRAKKTKNGDYVYITNTGTFVRLNAEGKQVKQFQVPQIPVLFGNIDILPNGNVLIPDFQQRRVVEYDTNGTQVGQISTDWPSSAMRLTNGNTLVASQNTRRVLEYNRAGQVVWSYDVEGQVFNARRR